MIIACNNPAAHHPTAGEPVEVDEYDALCLRCWPEEQCRDDEDQ